MMMKKIRYVLCKITYPKHSLPKEEYYCLGTAPDTYWIAHAYNAYHFIDHAQIERARTWDGIKDEKLMLHIKTILV